MNAITRPKIIILGIVSAISVSGYLVASYLYGKIGFPLDDAWIHQTYARNLALFGEWSYTPGQTSGGSTGPLWGAILAVGYLLGLSPYIWTFMVGWMSLWGLSIVGMVIFGEIFPENSRYSIWGGLLLSLEWHLVWLAGSGMETLLYAMVATLVLGWLLGCIDNPVKWVVIGGCIGISVWLRPDGITLLGPALMVLLLSVRKPREKFRIGIFFISGFMLVFIPYLLFNQLTAGSWWPNTFFAKQAEYAEYQNYPFLFRLANQILLPLVGVGLLLLPGFMLVLIDSVRRKRWELLAVILWLTGFLWLYAWRLPVTYQHGRYVMPMMPVAFIIGFAGVIQWVFKETQSRWGWVLRRTWVASIALVLGSFWALGIRAYMIDVAFIESEMVTLAHWLQGNLPENTKIGIHDIGAVGYFTDMDLVDLAGLVFPDVIPFIRDETRLAAYLDSLDVEYLVTFPYWYPELVSRAELIYQTNGTVAPSMDHDNLAVYRWNSP